MKRILVTGGFGFLGSHLTERLISDPANRVHVVDDMSTSPIDLDDYLRQNGNPSNLTYDILFSALSDQSFCVTIQVFLL